MRERLSFLARWSVLPVLVGLLLAGLGPFGTYDLPLWRRVGFWVPAVWVNWALTEGVIRGLVRAPAPRLPRPTLSLPLLASLAVAPAAVAVVYGLAWLTAAPLEAAPATVFWQVLLVTVAITLPGYAWSVARSNRAAAAADRAIDAALDATAADAGAGFARRWPAGLSGRLLFLEMEDHYLRIHTSEGSAVILCRMEDAAEELNGRGRRVHRSFWVAADAVAGARRQGQSWRLRLIDGREVPVGRTYRPALRAAGWLTSGDSAAA